MLRYKLRTLLILLAILPPLLWIGWTKYEAWKAEQERLKTLPSSSSKRRAGGAARIPTATAKPCGGPSAPKRRRRRGSSGGSKITCELPPRRES